MSNTVVKAIYDDEEPLMATAKTFRDKGIAIKDVFSPFPIHGIDDLIGTPKTRLAICAFLYGLTGAGLATLMMWYMMISDWPTDIGGKPSFAYYMNVPAFIPVTFESTVLCAAHGMVITYYLRCKMLPGVRAKNPDPRTTDDKFMVVVETTEDEADNVEALLKEGGASEVYVD